MLWVWPAFVTDLLMTHKTRTNYLECACYLTLSSRTIASVRIAQEYRNQTTNNWHWCVLSDSLCLLKGGQESYSMMILNGMANTMSRLKGVDLGNPNIFPLINFFKNLHHWIVMSKYIICQSFKKFHHAVFSIAHPKYSNFGSILDARW